MGKVKELQSEEKRRKQINKAAETYLSDQDEGDLYDAYVKLLLASEKGFGDDPADNFVQVWEPLVLRTSVDEMIHYIEDGINEPEVPEVLKKIDWTDLRTQKTALLEVIEFFGRVKFNMKTDENPRIIEGLDGILNLIDALQDFAVDEMGVNQIHVFDFEEEDKREGYNGDLNTPATPEVKSPTTEYKVWVEIERIELDEDGNDISYSDEECPIGIAYRGTLQEAVQLQELIENSFGEI